MDSVCLQVLPVGYEGRAVRLVELRLGSVESATSLRRSLERLPFVSSAKIYPRANDSNSYAIELDAWVIKPVMRMIAKRVSQHTKTRQVQFEVQPRPGLGGKSKVWTFRFR